MGALMMTSIRKLAVVDRGPAYDGPRFHVLYKRPRNAHWYYANGTSTAEEAERIARTIRAGPGV